MRGWNVRRGFVAVMVGLLVAAMATLTAGCSDDGDDGTAPAPAELRSWERGAVWPHADVYFSFDRVAVGGSADTISWMTRRTRGDTGELAYWELTGGAEATTTELPVADGGPEVVIPVDVAADAEGWAAVAAMRNRPRGENTGLLAWQTRRTSGQTPDVLPGVALTPPRGTSGAPDLASVGRSEGATVVAALFDGEVVLWTLPQEAAESNGTTTTTTAPPPPPAPQTPPPAAPALQAPPAPAQPGPAAPPTPAPPAPGQPVPTPPPPTVEWEAVQPELELDRGLVSLRVVGDGERFVMAGVDAEARAHVWTSTDGERWEPLPEGGDSLPTGVGAVGLLTPLAEGQVAVGWLADEDSAPANATSATIQRLGGDELSDQGTIVGDSGGSIDRLDLGGAALSPADRLVVVGTALRPSGDRAPMVWAQQGGEWRASRQSELAGRLDYEARAVTADDDRLLALVTGITHVDVESWRWRSSTD